VSADNDGDGDGRLRGLRGDDVVRRLLRAEVRPERRHVTVSDADRERGSGNRPVFTAARRRTSGQRRRPRRRQRRRRQ